MRVKVNKERDDVVVASRAWEQAGKHRTGPRGDRGEWVRESEAVRESVGVGRNRPQNEEEY